MKRLRSLNRNNEDMSEVKTLVILTLIIVALAAGLYFLTDRILENNEPGEPELSTRINYSTTIIGEMFSRPEREYFVLAYSSDSNLADFYHSLFANFERVEDNIKIYYIDLAMGFNSHVLSEESNPRPRNASEVKINEVALFRIRDGRVVSFYETLMDIRKALD
jgi:hypothetical protein